MCTFAFIKEEYFKIHNDYVEMLDPEDNDKQSSRQYLFLAVKFDGNNILIPLRRVLPVTNLKIGYPTPSKKRPYAGLDYRKMLIVEQKYLEIPTTQRLSNAQAKIIKNDYLTIEKSVIKYIKGYIKSCSKKRQYKDFEYKFSTLHNFHKELHIKINNKESDK